MMELDPFVSLWICEKKRDLRFKGLFVLKTIKLYQKYVVQLYVSTFICISIYLLLYDCLNNSTFMQSNVFVSN